MNLIFRKIVRIGEKIPIIKNLKPYALKVYNDFEIRKKKRLMKKKGLAILNEFDHVLTANHIPYSLVFGTLLGAVREKGFIKHDLDIDVGIWYDSDDKKIEKILIDSGFELIRRSETDDGKFGKEDTYMKDGIQIDIFYFYPYLEDKDFNAYTTVFVPFTGYPSIKESIEAKGGVMPIQLILPFSREVVRVPFESLYLPTIKNSIDFVEARYGKNWRIPDPTFVYPKMGDVKCKYRSDKLTKILVWK